MAETERKKSSKSRKIFVKVPKPKRAGHRHRNIRYHKTISDDEEFLVKNADLDPQDFCEMPVHALSFHRTETLGSHSELGHKESRNYTEKSENISSSSNLEKITDDGKLKNDEYVFKMSEIGLLETNRQNHELIFKSFNDVAIGNNETERVDANSRQTEACYFEEKPYEEVLVGRFKTLQTESPITAAHNQRKSESQRMPTSAEISAKTNRSNTFADRNHSRQTETGRRVKAIKRVSKKRWKKTKKSKKMEAEKETLPISISGDKDSEIIEILETDDDDKTQAKMERRKKRRKRAKKMAKTAGVTVWKGLREGWKLMWSGLAMYTLPLGSLDVSTNIAKVWSTKSTQQNH